MSKISLAPAAAGSAIFTIESPGTSTNRTLTLPDDTGTIVTNSGNQAGSFTTLNTSGPVVFNDAGADVDFRVEGDTDANLLFVDASADKVGIGTSSPAQRLHVANAGSVGTLIENTSGTGATYVQVKNTAGSSYLGQDSTGGYLLTDYSAPFLFYTNNTERMRIDSSGNVGIGTSSPSARLHVSGGQMIINTTDNTSNIYLQNSGTTYLQLRGDTTSAFLNNPSAGPMVFGTSDTERMRIDSSGNLLVGTTSPADGDKFNVTSTTNGKFAVRFYHNTASVPVGLAILYGAATPNNTGSAFLYCQDSTSLKMEVRSNGGIANYSANNVNLSDRREKTNFAPAKNYLDTICAIPVQTFNYVDQNLEEDDGLTLGVVAQDVQEVAPELVMESNWGTQEEPKMRLSIYQTDLQYALMKCIQELKAELDTVKTELATLKG